MKINISIPDEVSQKVDQFCDENNLKRSVVYQIAVQQFINQREAVNAFKKISAVLEKIDREGKLDEESKQSIYEMRVIAHVLGQNIG